MYNRGSPEPQLTPWHLAVPRRSHLYSPSWLGASSVVVGRMIDPGEGAVIPPLPSLPGASLPFASLERREAPPTVEPGELIAGQSSQAELIGPLQSKGRDFL